MDAGELRDHLVYFGMREYLRLSLTRAHFPATPAAGAEVTVTVPAGVIWQLSSLYAVLTTSATVATRVPQLVIADADGKPLEQYGVANGLPASGTAIYNWIAGLGVVEATSQDTSPLGTPAPVLLPGWTIKTATGNLQAADQWTLASILVTTWSPGSIAENSDILVSRFADLLINL